MSAVSVLAERDFKVQRGNNLFVMLSLGFKFRSVQSFTLPQLPLTPSKAPKVFSRHLTECFYSSRSCSSSSRKCCFPFRKGSEHLGSEEALRFNHYASASSVYFCGIL